MRQIGNVRLAAANILLDRGVRFTIQDAPWYWKLFRINRIHIRPLRAGAIMEISRLIDENGLDDIRIQKDANNKLDAISLIIAVAILNGEYRIKLLSGILSKMLLWKIPAHVLQGIYKQVAKINKLTDFMNITIYFGMQAEMMMSPRQMGQEEEGS
jgi:hypothetical protein